MDIICDSAGFMALGNGFQLYDRRVYSHLAGCRIGRSPIAIVQRTQSSLKFHP